MISIISLLLVIVISLLVVRIATVALTLTGLSRQLACFQARSAFTGSGFTTRESEKVVQHPVRRRIIMILMLLGNAGIVTAASSLILSFTSTGAGAGAAGNIWLRLAVLTGGLTILWYVAHSQWVNAWVSRVITHALKNWTDLEVRDYAGLLHLTGGYTVAEMQVCEGDWMEDRRLTELKPADEGVLVLGVEKPDGAYIGAPRGSTKLSADDTVLMYGPTEVLQNIDQRPSDSRGNWEHHRAVERQRRIAQREQHQLDEQQAEAEVVELEA